MKEELFKELEADAMDFAKADTESVSDLTTIINEAEKCRLELEEAEKAVKEIRKRYDAYKYERIPNLMQEMGVTELQAGDTKVKVRNYVSARMPKDPVLKAKALEHLRELGKGDFIKNDVTATFGVNQDDRAIKLLSELEGHGYDVASKTWVEPQTLKKVVRESVENREGINLDLFDAVMGTYVDIKGT